MSVRGKNFNVVIFLDTANLIMMHDGSTHCVLLSYYFQ